MSQIPPVSWPPQDAPRAGTAVPASMPQRPSQTSGAAIAGLVCGLASLLTMGATSVPGIILSVLGLRRVQRSDGRVGGEGLAMAGAITSVIGLLVGLMVLAMVLVHGSLTVKARRGLVRPPGGGSYSASEIARRSGQSMMGLQVLALAALDYAREHGGRLPLSDEFPLCLVRYIEGRQAPRAPPGRAFAMNAPLSGMRLADIDLPKRTVLFFESDAGGPVVGGPEILRSIEGDDDGFIIAFADGHVESVWPDDIDDFIWHPDKGPTLVKDDCGLRIEDCGLHGNGIPPG